MFTVQGEGRGHLTQAIAMRELLERHNHQVVSVVAGTNQTRSLPAFFEESFAIPIRKVESLSLLYRERRSVALWQSLFAASCGLAKFGRSLDAIRLEIEAANPDLIVNFLEPLMGVYNLLRPHSVPVISVGHQFMLEHPEHRADCGFRFQQLGMRLYLSLTAAKSKRLALSFYPARDVPRRKLTVSPPLLRQEVLRQTPERGDYLLVYLLNSSYAHDVIEWHNRNADVRIHCFCEQPDEMARAYPHENLTFHGFDGIKFLKKMAGARGVACTAGFESVSEAAYLGKPILVVPVENHVEQHINAHDAERAGLAKSGKNFDLSDLFSCPENDNAEFRNWVEESGDIVIRKIEETVRQKDLKAPRGRSS